MMVTDSTGYNRYYSHVISTIPLPVLRTLDLTGSSLSLYQQNALRQLQYGPSIKIGIQFRSAWWTYGADKTQPIPDIVGGQSYTDLPIRTVVYPSDGIKDGKPTDPAVLIASYCWTEDAQRLGALIAAFNPETFDHTQPLKDPLANLVLRDLAKLHDIPIQKIASQVLGIFPWDWNMSKYTMGELESLLVH